MKLDRRGFLIGLFSAAAVARAGPMPKALEQIPEEDFINLIKGALPPSNEIYSNGKGQYGFAKIEWLTKPPYIKVTVPEGFRPLRAESDRLADEAIQRMINDPEINPKGFLK